MQNYPVCRQRVNNWSNKSAISPSEVFFLFSQPKHMLWILRRTISMRQKITCILCSIWARPEKYVFKKDTNQPSQLQSLARILQFCM